MALKTTLKKIAMNLFNQVRISSNNRIQLSTNTRLRKCAISIGDGKNHFQVEDAQIRRCNITIEGHGNRLIIHKGCNLRGLIIEVLGNDCTLEIGRNVKNTGPGKLSCRENGTRLTIGDNSLLATGITMLTSDGHDIYDSAGTRINPAEDIIIGSQVWIGQEAMILKGAHIEDGCVIGARSIVTGEIEATSIAVGNPARPIRSNIAWDERLTY
ncbi:acyltransferase [Aeromonas hydrophila]|uniref:acyltransferase n=2 Tax=Aeromonas hydrophila TaxID=644 RepID=UPI00256F015B|nr:acyltransferase [Aeromonas hydrophila]MDL5386685.1 acyltransferase [Aeromonas hydrophila]